MLTHEELKDFARTYKDVVLDTPYGELHLCGDKKIYEELIRQGKAAFSPCEISLLPKAARNGSLDTLIKIKTFIPGAKLKEIIPASEEDGSGTKGGPA